jgi:ABC-2 type transport system ATP-binding protein
MSSSDLIDARLSGTDDPHSGPGRALLAVRELSRSFGPRQVLHSLDLTLGPGERLAVRGPNGSGKTTLLRCIAGTLTPTAGNVFVCGYPGGSFEARRLIGASLSQERSFYMRLTGRQNLLLFARLRTEDARRAATAVRSIEEELEIGELASQRVDRCSTGMIQQLAVGRALLGEPALLLLDEPTRSLDKDAVARVWAAIERRPQTGVVLATHSDDDAARCDDCVDLGA